MLVRPARWVIDQNYVMGLTWLMETRDDHEADVAHRRAAHARLVRTFDQCTVEGCEWRSDGTCSLAEHMALEHPVLPPRLLVDGTPARAVQDLRELPQPGVFAIERGRLEFRQADRPWRTVAEPDDLVAEMRNAPKASDWTVRLRATGYDDLAIVYRFRLRVITDDQTAAIDDDFLRRFAAPTVSLDEVLRFASAWREHVVEEHYAGALANGMQYLVLRGKDADGRVTEDAGRAIRGLASYAGSAVAAMLCDVLRLCDLDVGSPAAQDGLPEVSFALDLLHAASQREECVAVAPPPAGGDAQGIYVDGATAELLDRVLGLMRSPDEVKRSELSSELVAWADAPGRLAADRDKALAFAVLGSGSADPARAEWAGRLVHHPVLGPWAHAASNEGAAK
jgi:hypothetical protein